MVRAIGRAMSAPGRVQGSCGRRPPPSANQGRIAQGALSAYLQPDFRCLCCKRRSSRASARTRYLQRCLRRTGTDATHVTCVYPLLAAALDVSRLIRTVRRRHVTAAEPLVTGTFSMGTSDKRRSEWSAQSGLGQGKRADLVDPVRRYPRGLLPRGDRIPSGFNSFRLDVCLAW
jgi:hypothetical protein